MFAFSFDLSAFLTQNNAFYIGFTFGAICGVLMAFLFFKTSLRFAKNHCKRLENELKRKDNDLKALNEHIKNILECYLSQKPSS